MKLHLLFIMLCSWCYHVVSFSNHLIKCASDCSQIKCNHYKTLKRFCRYGTVSDHCGCCQVCALGPHEECGGPSDAYGKCGPGLYCFPEHRHPSQTGRCIRKLFDQLIYFNFQMFTQNLMNYYQGDCPAFLAKHLERSLIWY